MLDEYTTREKWEILGGAVLGVVWFFGMVWLVGAWGTAFGVK